MGKTQKMNKMGTEKNKQAFAYYGCSDDNFNGCTGCVQYR